MTTDLFESLLPHLSALTLHHVEPRQDDQVRMKVVQTGHECLQRAHLSVRHIVGEDEAVGLRCLSGTPLFTYKQRSKPDCRIIILTSYFFCLHPEGGLSV